MLPAVTTEVRDNRGEEQYEIWVDGEQAGLVAYVRHERDGVIDLIHTEVDKRFQGQGIAGQLVTAVLDDARKSGMAVRPDCPYVLTYIQRHEPYHDLIRHQDRERYGL
jgi:uncharacterized protein